LLEAVNVARLIAASLPTGNKKPFLRTAPGVPQITCWTGVHLYFSM